MFPFCFFSLAQAFTPVDQEAIKNNSFSVKLPLGGADWFVAKIGVESTLQG
jgi:hypothetical protein